jgi:hypothetical protein
MQVISMEEEIKLIVKELESIFTIDGRGRPEKASTFLRLIDNYGSGQVIAAIKKISERKNL